MARPDSGRSRGSAGGEWHHHDTVLHDHNLIVDVHINFHDHHDYNHRSGSLPG